MKSPIAVHFDVSAPATVRRVMLHDTAFFVEASPQTADVVVFGSDDLPYIKASGLYRQFASKSICITESDIPTFRLPGLYAANQISPLTMSRTKTINYFISERDRPNPEVRGLVGQSVEKTYLYSFMGGPNSWARKRLFAAVHSQSDTLIESTSSYNHWQESPVSDQHRANQRLRYARVMASSKFVLCPRGCGLSSYRLFESMMLGIAPVIIADKWQPIDGIDWSFALFVPEKRIPQIDRIVRSHADEWQERGQIAAAVYSKVLDKDRVAALIRDQVREVLSSIDPRRERRMAAATQMRVSAREAYWASYGVVKHLVLWSLYLTGRSSPVIITQPIDVQLKRQKIGP